VTISVLVLAGKRGDAVGRSSRCLSVTSGNRISSGPSACGYAWRKWSSQNRP